MLTVVVMKLLFMYFFNFHVTFSPLGPNVLPVTLFSANPQITSFPFDKMQSVTPIQKNM